MKLHSQHPGAAPAMARFPSPPPLPVFASHPSDIELIEMLLTRVQSSAATSAAKSFIHDADICADDPADLTRRFAPAVAQDGMKVWYFFSPLKQKNQRGKRMKRCTDSGDGVWHDEGKIEPIKTVNGDKETTIGHRNLFSFRKTVEGKKKARTGWIMNEFRLQHGKGENFVLCKVYASRSKRKRSKSAAAAARTVVGLAAESSTAAMKAAAAMETAVVLTAEVSRAVANFAAAKAELDASVAGLTAAASSLPLPLSQLARSGPPSIQHVLLGHLADYICTENDIALIESVKSNSSGDELLVEIDHALVYRRDLQCLFQRNEYLNDAVVSAYIRLLRTKDNLRCRTGGKVYLEDPFISSILKRDGNPKIAINPKCDTMQKTVDNYLDNDMVFIPINIKETHWYLAVVNAKKCEIQVLDSLDCALGLEDLTTTLKGLQRYINIASLFKELKGHKWPSLQVATWPVTKIFEGKLQKDSASCGLFMLKYMEYWTGDMLSDEITQDDMTKFRPKLGAILLSSKLNKKGRSLVQPINEAKECSDDFVMLSSPKQVSAQTVMKTKTMIAAVQVAAQRSKRATRNTTTTVEAVQAMSAELVTTMEEVNEMLAKVEAAKAVTEATVASDAAAMDEAVPVLEAEATANEAVPEAEATTDEATGAAITVVQKGKDDNETDELLLSSVQKKIVNIQPRQPPSDSMENGHPQTLARRAPCEYYEPENKVLGIRTLGDPQDTVGTSMEVDGSFVSSMSSENSVEESSFRQLQDAVSQLDVQIKLCIRDGLYRLARSAQHRQVSPSTMSSNGNSQDTKDMQNAETSRKFVNPRSIETQLKPIDRCIALLIFHQSPANIAGAVDDASSLKCHKKQYQSPAKNQDSSIQSPGGQDWSIFPDDWLPFMFPDEWMEFLHLD